MRLKKADSASLNDTAGEYLIHLFKHLAKFVTYLISTHLINPNEKVINIQQIYTGITNKSTRSSNSS